MGSFFSREEAETTRGGSPATGRQDGGAGIGVGVGVGLNMTCDS